MPKKRRLPGSPAAATNSVHPAAPPLSARLLHPRWYCHRLQAPVAELFKTKSPNVKRTSTLLLFNDLLVSTARSKWDRRYTLRAAYSLFDIMLRTVAFPGIGECQEVVSRVSRLGRPPAPPAPAKINTVRVWRCCRHACSRLFSHTRRSPGLVRRRYAGPMANCCCGSRSARLRAGWWAASASTSSSVQTWLTRACCCSVASTRGYEPPCEPPRPPNMLEERRQTDRHTDTHTLGSKAYREGEPSNTYSTSTR